MPYTSTITGIREIAPNVHEVTLNKPESMVYAPGQYSKVTLTSATAGPKEYYFSYASAPDEEELLFVIKPTSPESHSAEWFRSDAREGLSMDIDGPYDNLPFGKASGDLVLMATGTGIAPFRSYLCSNAYSNSTGSVDLFFGVRSEEDLFWQDAFGQLAQSHPNFSFHPVLSRPSQDWNGQKGYVQNAVPGTVEDIADKTLFICGNKPMVEETKKKALEEWGVDEGNIYS